jgi:hypothetical protein
MVLKYVCAEDLVKPFPLPYHMVKIYAFLLCMIWPAHIVSIIHDSKVNIPIIV